jgi:hypothetical protein
MCDDHDINPVCPRFPQPAATTPHHECFVLIRPSDREGPESFFKENGADAPMRLPKIETVTIAAVSAMRVKEA